MHDKYINNFLAAQRAGSCLLAPAHAVLPHQHHHHARQSLSPTATIPLPPPFNHMRTRVESTKSSKSKTAQILNLRRRPSHASVTAYIARHNLAYKPEVRTHMHMHSFGNIYLFAREEVPRIQPVFILLTLAAATAPTLDRTTHAKIHTSKRKSTPPRG